MIHRVLVLLSLAALLVLPSFGQCTGNSVGVPNGYWSNSQYPTSPPWSGQIPPSTQGAVLAPPCDAPGYGTNCNVCPSTWNAGVAPDQFVPIYLCAGQRYEFSTCSSPVQWDAQLTLVNTEGTVVAFDDDGCGTPDGHAFIHYSPSVSGQYRINVNNPDCEPEPGIYLQLTFKCLPAYCPTAGDTPCGAPGGGSSCNPNIPPCATSIGAVPLGEAASICTPYSATMNGNTPSGIPIAGCGMEVSDPDVWFTAVIPTNGQLLVDVTSTGTMDLAMAMYTAPSCVGPFSLQQCIADLIPGIELDPSLEIERQDLAGQEIYIRVWQEGGSAVYGSFTICLRVLHPTNDEPCGAIPLAPQFGCMPTPLDMLGSTLSSSPVPGCSTPTSDMWFTVEVPDNGEVQFDSDDLSISDAAIAVYRQVVGSCEMDDLVLEQVPEGCSTDGSAHTGAENMPSLFLTGLVPGEQLWLRVLNEEDANGSLAICASFSTLPPVVPNELCYLTLRMRDHGGDGWDGSFVRICLYGEEVVCNDYTLLAGQGEISIPFAEDQVQTMEYFPSGVNEHEIFYDMTISGLSMGASSGTPPESGLIYVGGGDFCAFGLPSISDCEGAFSFLYYPSISEFGGRLQHFGVHEDLDENNRGCLESNEQLGMWFEFIITQSTRIAFMIEPGSAGGQNNNFALWGPTTTMTCPPQGMPIRCSFADQNAPTGLADWADDESEGLEGDGWLRPIDALQGERYMLYITTEGTRPGWALVTSLLSTGEVLSEWSEAVGVLVVPNPVSTGQISIRTSMPMKGITQVRCMDTSGRSVHTSSGFSSTGSKDLDINIPNLVAGTYLLELLDEHGICFARTRFVKLDQ